MEQTPDAAGAANGSAASNSVEPSFLRDSEPDSQQDPEQDPDGGQSEELRELLHALRTMRAGDFSVRMAGSRTGIMGEVADTFNEIAAALYRKTGELQRLNAELEQRMAERTAELEASNARLLQSEEGRSLALAAGQMGSWDWDLVTGEWKWDEGQYHIYGVDRGRSDLTLADIRAMTHPEDWDRLLDNGLSLSKGARSLQTEFRVVRPDGKVRWCIGTAAATFDPADRVVRLSGVTVDITERKEAEERQDLLAREVDHRARNALAVVQSIIRLTRARSVDDYVTAVEGRIKALARAHALLSNSRWHGADLRELVAEELAPYRVAEAGKIEIEGPDFSLPPHMAQALGLALHELATNAGKHGALSSLAGKVSLAWQLQPDCLMLRWVESGGPPITPPSAGSFGLNVIRAGIEQQLGGEANFEWKTAGLQCTLSIPLLKPMNQSAATADEPADESPVLARRRSHRRVLLVEDEALVAMMIQQCLAEQGDSVVGPISTAAEALAAAREDNFDAAILDINLADGLAYPVADILSARGVPFVFVTGYEADTVDGRFGEVPILQKPIERQMLRRIFAP